MTAPTFVSLFSGIEGFGLGFERAGMRLVAQVENDHACIGQLARHYPHVPRFGDIQEVDPDGLPAADLVCGGFPCQDLSVAGGRAGLAGERSSLWWQFWRILAGHRPRWVVIENVPGLLSAVCPDPDAPPLLRPRPGARRLRPGLRRRRGRLAMTRYGVVVAFELTDPQLDRDQLREELAAVVESQYDVDGPVSVAVREVKPHNPKAKTKGRDIPWGSGGV